MKISGVFKFYQNGELIGEAENSMTEMGRVLAVKTIMGAIPNFATSMGVGVSSTANQTANVDTKLIPDSKLGLMVATMPVIGTNITTNATFDALLFKGRFADPLYYRIHEIGLFSDPLLSGSSGYRQELVLGFENNDDLFVTGLGYLNSISNATYKMIDRTDATYGENFRIGRKALYAAGTAEIYTENSFTGLQQYDPTDELTLGAYSITSTSVSVKFYSNSATKTFTFTLTGGSYNVVSRAISTATDSGTGFDWNNITKVAFICNNGSVILDGLRFNDVNPIDTNRGMISRAVLPTALIKFANIPIDIEYTLRIGFNG